MTGSRTVLFHNSPSRAVTRQIAALVVTAVVALQAQAGPQADEKAPRAAADGLIGHWQFDGCDGRTVRDRSPRGNDGSIEFGMLRQEKGGTSLELDGLDGHVMIRETTPLGLTDAMTAALWVKPLRLRGNTVLFGVPHVRDSWTTPVFGMYVFQQRVVYGMWLGQRQAKVLVESPDELPLDAWTFLAAAYDGASVRLYVNGRLAAERPAAGAIAFNGQPLIIGKGAGSSKPSLRGRVGELRLYERSLSPDEVWALYEKTRAAYDLQQPAKQAFPDGTVIVETHGNRPGDDTPWRAQTTRLLELLAGYQPPAEPVKVDRYGGRLDRPREKATGYFFVKKIDGRHWLIDPAGCRFFHVAINAVREPRDVAALFGSAEGWAEAVVAQLRAAGFNGLGNGNSPRLRNVKSPLVWVRRKDFMFAFAREKKLNVPASGTLGFIDGCMPVFHPDFEPFCEQFGKDLADTAEDPCLLGIMTDNELQCRADLLDRYLALDAGNPDLKPGRDAAAAWLVARKGSADLADITTHDRYEFIAYAFERYYRIVSKVIRRNDPHHLYLGSRINYRTGQFDNPWFWKALAPYHDVVSVNYYGVWGPDKAELADWETWAGRPILLTEWYAKAQDVPGLANTHGAGWLVHTQEDRARYYQHFALKALELPNIVGWHWFKYLDDPAESQALDSAGGANKGMFDLQGNPYPPLYDRARAVNRQVYPLIDFFDARNRGSRQGGPGQANAAADH